jgi:lipopolysaccharide assembly outer membrane protein LptD (OstA)
MKRVLLMACFASICAGQQAASGVFTGEWESKSQSHTITNDGHVAHWRGNVEMRGDGKVFHADAIDYDSDKTTLRLIGHVTIETEKGTFNADEGEYNVASGDLTLRIKLKN